MFPWRQLLTRSLLHRGLFLLCLVLGLSSAIAQETVCAQVKIELKQQLTLERQAFDAQATINNALQSASLTDISVLLKVTEENGTPVLITADPNDTSARFFVRLASTQGISDLSGNGTVPPSSTATADWLLIPAPGAAGSSPLGKKYLIGASLQYKFGGEVHSIDVAPAIITVKPMPLLTLDYFITKDVIADDPLTPEIEPAVPFTLGVRVKNTGAAVAKNLKIDSAQPRIVDNAQGLAINFKLTGSYLNDAPTQNTLLINFGDVPASTSKMGRWVMESTLAGRFIDFTARFSHADELGGAVTSLMQATNAHLLVRDVRVDLPGRDPIRDFLAQDGDILRIYESEGQDSLVQDLSSQAGINAGTSTNGNAVYRLSLPATQGFLYARLPDPYGGAKALATLTRSDGKVLAAENLWLSRNRNASNQWEYWINLFDANSPGNYDAEFAAPPVAAQPPVIQVIPDRTIVEGQQVAFLVEASSPMGKPVSLSATPLPAGANFQAQAADPASPGLARAAFDWTPAKGQAGSYLIVYTATDGSLSSTRAATIKVNVDEPPPGPATPTLDSPVSGAQVPSTAPVLAVVTGSNPKDPTTLVQFEIYRDEAMTQLVTAGSVNKGVTAGTPGSTSFTPADPLQDNTPYWWRARAYDGSKIYSPWVNGRFFVNLFNDPPDTFNLTTPIPGGEVAEAQPRLSWSNSADKDGDAITYRVEVYRDGALTDLLSSASDLVPGEGGSSSWQLDQALNNHATYYWKVVAKDANGAETATAARAFVVNTGNTAPTPPQILLPLPGGQSASASTVLTIQNSSDAENDPIDYLFELDQVNTFDSGAKRASGPVAQGIGNTGWNVDGLVENRRYWWRAKARDGRAESDWVVGDFLMNAYNEAPPAPTVKNPGNAAWSASVQPSFEANPVVDPEGDGVIYRYEVYKDSALANRIADGISTTGAWLPATPLADKTSYWWRVRAEDPQNAASAWSPATLLYVSSGPYQDPTIQLTSPATPVPPDANKKLTLRWEGIDPNIEPTIALYYGSSNSGYGGTLIVDGLTQPAGTQSGSYVWDVSALAPGTYYVYAVIYDPKGIGKAYAPGALVVPSPAQSGKILVHPKHELHLRPGQDETGRLHLKLGTKPTQNVVVPLSVSASRGATVSPTSLTFTPDNWNVFQKVTVRGGDSCSRARLHYQVLIGKAQSLDPNYSGISAKPVEVEEPPGDDKASTTNDKNLLVCHVTKVSERKVDRREWEYSFSAELTNIGPAVSGVKATVQWVLPALANVFGLRIVDNALSFGAVPTDETVKSTDTITVRTSFQLPDDAIEDGKWIRWNVGK
ncbi:MAG TPA: hypothetical protein VI279_13380 [Rhodocyclaceae bacterium]